MANGVYAYFGNRGVFCYDVTGELVWSRKLAEYATRGGWGNGASPVLHGDCLFLVNDNEEQSSLLALNKYSGEVVWQVERDERSNWATPLIWENSIRTEIVTSGRGGCDRMPSTGKCSGNWGACRHIPFPRHAHCKGCSTSVLARGSISEGPYSRSVPRIR